MTFIEAIKLNKPFKRKGRESYWQPFIGTLKCITVGVDDILATDWEIEEEKILISQTEFYNGITDEFRKIMSDRNLTWHGHDNNFQDMILKSASNYWVSLKENLKKD